MAYSFLKKTSHHSLTGWNSQGTHSNATCKSCCFLETLKKSFFPYFIDRRVWLNKRLEQTCIIWSQVKNTSFLPKKSADISVLSSSDFRFESPLCSLGNHHMNTWIMQHFQLLLTRGTAQGLEAKGVGTLTYQKDGKIYDSSVLYLVKNTNTVALSVFTAKSETLA